MMTDYKRLPTPNGGKPFEHPSHAQAFAMVVRLNETGLFAWDEWVEVFSGEIARSPAAPDETADQAYYRQWVSAIDRHLISLGVLTEGDMTERAAVWRQAYLNTPHGEPIALANATCAPRHTHHHSRVRGPIAVSTASVQAPETSAA